MLNNILMVAYTLRSSSDAEKIRIISARRARRKEIPMTEPCNATAEELALGIRLRKWSAIEVLDAHLARIRVRNPDLNAIVLLDSLSTAGLGTMAGFPPLA